MTNTITIGARSIPLRGLKHGDLPNDCWLNGHEAVISWPAVDHGFALVRGLTGPVNGIGCEWSLDAAKRIFARDRQFKS